MKTAYSSSLALIFLIHLVASCSTPAETTPSRMFPTETTLPDATSVLTPTSDLAIIPSPIVTMPAPTWIVNSNPVLSDVYYSANPITDGKLELSIGSFDDLCFHPGETVYFQTMFANVSDEDITLVDFNYPSRKETTNASGQMYPILTTLDGKEIYPDTYFSSYKAINPRSPVISVIHPGVILVVGEGYQIPQSIGLEDKDRNLTFQSLSSGRYLLKFVYMAIGHENSWKGNISSNQIKVCVIE